MNLKNFYNNKKVFLTGHTGFKGAWMSMLLKELGAIVTGYSLPPEDIRGNLFNLLKLNKEVSSIENDICNKQALQQAIEEAQPEIVFHLAAQPLVIESYNIPVKTYQTNVMGTINLLDICRNINTIKAIVVITTDKCYENKEWFWAYRENDPLGGFDPYSSSKSMAELAVSSYRQSFFNNLNVGLASARAGNVIGGGDFAKYRIIPDIAEAIMKNEKVSLRNPNSIRPWQHVLDALYGYLLLAKALYNTPKEFGTAFNFSPDDNSNNHTVEYITKKFIKFIEKGHYDIKANSNVHEATYLRLDSSKAKSMLNWKPLFLTEEAINFTADWYKTYINDPINIKTKTLQQINYYLEKIND